MKILNATYKAPGPYYANDYGQIIVEPEPLPIRTVFRLTKWAESFVSDLVWAKHSFGNYMTVYIADDEDCVEFLVHSPSNETGYGGSLFTLQLTNGETDTIKGPWSGSICDMNQKFLSIEDQIAECITTTGLVCNVKVARLRELGLDMRRCTKKAMYYVNNDLARERLADYFGVAA